MHEASPKSPMTTQSLEVAAQRCFAVLLLVGWGHPLPCAAAAPELKLLLPLQRTAYQCNEPIHLSVVRTGADELPGGDLVLSLSGQDGSHLTFTFPAAKLAASQGPVTAVEHLQVNGWYLRPDTYAAEVSCDGVVARTNFAVFSHIRQSSFKLINWGRAQGREQLCEGEENLGFNLFYGHYGDDAEANFIRAGVDCMGCCVMSGGRQMDLRQECDWSDPYVVRGGTRRVVRKALQDRTRPNVWGVHFYDEPGLNEAVGTLYDLVSGMDPLTPLALPQRASVTPATRSDRTSAPGPEWSQVLVDRIQGLQATSGKVSALCHDGSLFELGPDGKQTSPPRVLSSVELTKTLEAYRSAIPPTTLAEAQRTAPPTRLVKQVLANGSRTAISYWGGGLAVFLEGKLSVTHQFAQDLTAMAWMESRLIIGDADGRVTALSVE